MTDKVYIGYGNKVGAAYGINLIPLPCLKLFGNLKKEICYLTQYNKEIGRELNPKGVFVIIENTAKKLMGHVCGDSINERYDNEKSQVLEAPEFTLLREYLTTENGDRVIATHNSLVDMVDNIVRGMGYETVHFS